MIFLGVERLLVATPAANPSRSIAACPSPTLKRATTRPSAASRCDQFAPGDTLRSGRPCRGVAAGLARSRLVSFGAVRAAIMGQAPLDEPQGDHGPWYAVGQLTGREDLHGTEHGGQVADRRGAAQDRSELAVAVGGDERGGLVGGVSQGERKAVRRFGPRCRARRRLRRYRSQRTVGGPRRRRWCRPGRPSGRRSVPRLSAYDDDATPNPDPPLQDDVDT
jgi:hypothetical protein